MRAFGKCRRRVPSVREMLSISVPGSSILAVSMG
jgi:hypothetical protein